MQHWRVVGREEAQSEAREAVRARGGVGFESARSGLEPGGGVLPVQARFLLSLQQSAGNRAVTGLVQGRFGPVQREGAEEEEPLQGRFAPVQRQAGEEDEELQLKAASSAPAQLQPENAPRRNETGLPDGLKSGIESLSGISLDDVRVRYGSAKPAELNALAYAQGSEIHVAPGQEQHLPHEAWHVVQQAQGRVQPTLQLEGGIPVNDDEGLEDEADIMGAKALGFGAERRGRQEGNELPQGYALQKAVAQLQSSDGEAQLIEEVEDAGGAIQGRFNGKSRHVPVLQRAFTARRPLSGKWTLGLKGAPFFKNKGVYHEHIFLEDNKSPDNYGFSKKGVFQDDPRMRPKYVETLRTGLDDSLMRGAVKEIGDPGPGGYELLGFNCQRYVSRALRIYDTRRRNAATQQTGAQLRSE